MAGPFRLIYPLAAFDGGLNNKYTPTIIEDNESSDCLNVVYDDLGAVATRDGSTQLNTAAAAGSFACDGLFTTRFNDGSETMVAAFNGSLYDLQSTSFITIGSAQSVFTAGVQVNQFMYQNHSFFGNGTTPYKYNGTEFTRQSVDVPNSLPSPATSSAGTLAGSYRYKFAYVNSLVVTGNPSSNTTAITIATERVNLTSIPVGPVSFGVDARKIYRTYDLNTAAASGTYYLVDTVADNTTTSYEDNSDDSELGVEAPSDNGLPPDWNFAISFQERVWCVETDENPQYLYYSNLGEPFTFGSANFIKIADGDGEAITGLGIQGNALAIYKESSVWLLFMPDTTPANWVRIKSNAKAGAWAHKTIADFENLQMFFGKRDDTIPGFYALNGNVTDPDSTLLTVGNMMGDSKSDRIEPDVFLMQTANAKNAVAIRYKNKLWYSVTYGSGNTTNNRIYQFDFARRGKSRRSGSWVPFTGLAVADFTIYDGKLYYGDANATGLVYQLEAGVFSDNGTAIDSYMWTKEIEGTKNDEQFEKDFRHVNWIMETLGAWNIGITVKVDSDRGGGDVNEIDITPGGSLWGSMVWGSDDWGGGVLRDNFKFDLGTSVGKRIQFKFDNRNTAGPAFKVIRGDMFYNRRGLR